jgi:hypothetical protein
MSQDNPSENLVLAVHDKDLDKVLREIGLLEPLEGTGIPCEVCKSNVTKANLGYIFLVAGKYEVCCDRIFCYYQFMKRTRAAGRGTS